MAAILKIQFVQNQFYFAQRESSEEVQVRGERVLVKNLVEMFL